MISTGNSGYHHVVTGSAKFYDRLSFLYPVIDLFLRSSKRKFFQKINSYPPGSLLEVGVGNGKHLKYYTTHDVTGIDTSQGMLSRARTAAGINIRLLQMNGEELSFPDEVFDYVVMSHVIAVVQDPEKLLEEVFRVLKPEGKVFILNHFTPDNWLGHVDRASEKLARLLHFRSIFTISGLNAIRKFKLLSECTAGMFSYFKILIYEKKI